jgi:AcrR family transcriptional regulator
MHTPRVTRLGEGAAGNRLQRRKERTRAALVRAAQRLIAEGRVNVPVLEITQAADVGMGSFYNHFDSKEQLFEAAVADVLDAHGALLDRLTASIEDPAETFATSFRLTGRLFRQRPQESEILLANGSALLSSDRGLAPRALRDIKAAADAGRFRVDDPELALAVAGGALLGLGALLREDRDRDDAHAADTVTENMLRLFGLSADEAHSICQRPLPDLDAWGQPDSAA